MNQFWSMLLLVLFLRLSSTFASPSGPTVHFDYGVGQPVINPLYKFMYFVPLISPELVSVFTNTGNSQGARVFSFKGLTNAAAFQVSCEFDFLGEGLMRDDFDHSLTIRRHSQVLKSGKGLAHQIASITVQGPGSGVIDIEGTFIKGGCVVTGLRMRFNSHGHISPVNIMLEDIYYRDGGVHFENQTVARVNSLRFFQKAGEPKMEVTLASVKRKAAGNGFFQNLVGEIKGAAANLLLPPLSVTPDGYSAMTNFGAALAGQKATFTFPFAARLTANSINAINDSSSRVDTKMRD